MHLLQAYLLAVNLVTLLFYGYDKLIAGTGILRVPEKVLHALAIAGGSAGALAGQKLFRHKTAKGSFQLVFWLILIAQLGLLWLIENY